MRYKKTKLSGWGNYPVVETKLYRPEKISNLLTILNEESLIARGLGRSYGDTSLNKDGATILMTQLNRLLGFDDRNGILHAEAGVSFDDILTTFVPRGWFPPVTPGTKFVTLGGAIASDVHGKNHHGDGALSGYVQEIELMIANGEVLRCSQNKNPEIFWATLGGNGLTGLILSAKIKMKAIETSYIKQYRVKSACFEDALDVFEEYDREYPYSVAWIDCLSGGKNLGRSIVTFGRHALKEELMGEQNKILLKIHEKSRMSIPIYFPNFTLNSLSIRMFNEVYYRRNLSPEKHLSSHYNSFFYPLDVVNHWNRIYGKAGFLQWQCVLPIKDGKENMRDLLQLIQTHRKGSFLAVLKKMADQKGLLNFPREGYTLALDFKYDKTIHKLIKTLNSLVVEHKGRIYLTKDAVLDYEAFKSMYPHADEWKRVKKDIDPKNIFSSDQARRLQLLN